MSCIQYMPVNIAGQSARISAAFAKRFPILAAEGHNNLLMYNDAGAVAVQFADAHACSFINCSQCTKEISLAKSLLERMRAPHSAL